MFNFNWFNGKKTIECNKDEEGFIPILAVVYTAQYLSRHGVMFQQGEESEVGGSAKLTFEEAQNYIDSTVQSMEQEGRQFKIKESRIYYTSGDGKATLV